MTITNTTMKRNRRSKMIFFAPATNAEHDDGTLANFELGLHVDL